LGKKVSAAMLGLPPYRPTPFSIYSIKGNCNAMTNHTSIRFWSGLRTIGGTIVTIEYGGARIVFDFGTAFLGGSPVADKEIRLRGDALVHDYVKLGVLPAIDGIYAESMLLSGTNVVPAEQSVQNTAVFISHLHLDHMSMMGLIAPAIPVYMSSESRRLYRTLAEIGEGVPGMREYHSMDMNETVHIGEIEVTALPMDHDIPGACGFHIRTPDGSLLYTGDLRFHGFNPERTKESLKAAKEMGIDMLIIEGTMLWEPTADGSLGELSGELEIPEDMATEQTLPVHIAETLLKTSGITVFNINHRNVGRLISMADAANKAGRTAVLEPETAYMFFKHTGRRDALVYESSAFRRQLRSGSLSDWQNEVAREFTWVTAEEINRDPARFLVQIDYRNLLELLDLHTEGGVFIHSDGMPLGSYDPSYERLLQVLEMSGMTFQPHRVTGHALARHLKWVVDFLDPDVLVPLHSFYPERLLPKTGLQLLPQTGQTYVLKDHVIHVAD
jgi:ribonuclease J